MACAGLGERQFLPNTSANQACKPTTIAKSGSSSGSSAALAGYQSVEELKKIADRSLAEVGYERR